jgi:uncharacterized protein (DUF305 family)
VKRIGRSLIAVLAMGMVLAACGSSNRVTQQGHEQSAAPKASGAAAVDRAFIKGMVPHHAGAIDMAKVERDKGKRAEVKDLAQSIIDAQEREIAEMSDIAKNKYGFTPQRERHGEMGTLMGMRISSDMAMMGQMVADAPDTDMAFLMMMRPHHASAIVMADEEMNKGGDAQLKKIAEMIVADQAKELGHIQQLLGSGH